ncbi:MAG: ABC transporter ATP-binding protein, partial [Pseudohongiellaceae bacterium]
TLECVLGMQGFDTGHIRVLGFNPVELHKSRGRVVGIFDTPSLHPNLTVRQNLEHARLLCAAPVRASTEVEKLLDIERYSGFRIRHLSLGNRRRASIAQALLGNPEMIVLDEPFNGLDAEGVEHVLDLIRMLNREEGTAFLLSSHQLPYLEQICTHMAILHRGTIPVSGAAEDLFRQQKVKLAIRCDQPAFAIQILAAAALGEFTEQSGGLIEGILTDRDSATVNRLLVEAGIAVFELMPGRASLASLFHTVTSESDNGS